MFSIQSKFRTSFTLPIALLLAWAAAHLGRAQTLVNHDDIPSSGLKLEIKRFAQIPKELGITPRITYLTHAPGEDRLFVATHGQQTSIVTASIYTIDSSSGTPVVSQLSDLGNVLDSVNGAGLALSLVREGGLRSFAFHPDFDDSTKDGYRKFYTSHQEVAAGGIATLPYLGQTAVSDGLSDSVVGEWSFAANGQVDVNSYREVVRMTQPWSSHSSKQIAFNPFAEPGEDDYGILYWAHGDAGQAGIPQGTGQEGQDGYGKILRINPLQAGENSYSVPASNPFTAANDPNDDFLDEIYALGFRSPHRFTWVKDDQEDVHMIATDIGEDNVEEVNVILPGENYGWREREGTFRCLGACVGNGIGNGVATLFNNEWVANDHRYPAAQYGHDGNSPPRAIGGVAVIQNSSNPALEGQVIFTDFPEDSTAMHVPLDDLLAAKTKLDDFDATSELTPATIQRLGVLFDDDDDPNTPAIDTTLNDVIRSDPDYEGGNRTEAFFYTGKAGEVYITNKRNGWIYLVTNTLPTTTIDADFDGDGDVDGNDFLILQRGYGLGSTLAEGDTNNDGVVDEIDLANWESLYGGGAPLASSQAVPEPAGLTLLLVGCWTAFTRRPRVTREN